MRDLYNNVLPVRALQIQTIAAGALNTGDVDLQGFESAQLVVEFGDIDEMGASPVGGAQIDVKLEHADDDGTGSAGAYADVVLSDVVGPASVAAGVVASPTTDTALVRFGYVGGKRFIRVTLTPSGLSNGGPVGVLVLQGHPHHAPV